MKRIDLVVPAYNEEAVLDTFFPAVLGVLDRMTGWDGRVILVDDGSKDATWARAQAWRDRDPRVTLVALSRNFGHEAALAAGLETSTGDAVVVLDADLQDPPDLIPLMAARFDEGFDVVDARRSRRASDSWLKRVTARGFYRVINHFSGKVRIPADVGNFRLLSRRVVEVLNALPEKNRVFRVLVPWLGFSTATVEYERPARVAGQTHYNYRSMVRLAVDGITSATTIPLQFAVRAGFVVSALGFAGIVAVFWDALVLHNTVDGWASTITVILFLGGIQLVFLGVIGEYLGRIFLEVKNRPGHVVRETLVARKDPTTP